MFNLSSSRKKKTRDVLFELPQGSIPIKTPNQEETPKEIIKEKESTDPKPNNGVVPPLAELKAQTRNNKTSLELKKAYEDIQNSQNRNSPLSPLSPFSSFSTSNSLDQGDEEEKQFWRFRELLNNNANFDDDSEDEGIAQVPQDPSVPSDVPFYKKNRGEVKKKKDTAVSTAPIREVDDVDYAAELIFSDSDEEEEKEEEKEEREGGEEREEGEEGEEREEREGAFAKRKSKFKLEYEAKHKRV